MASRSFSEHLQKQQLSAGTVKCYTAIADRIGRKDPIKFLRKRITPATPVGTVLTLRAAVKHFLIGHKKLSPEEATELLPKAKGAPSQLGHSLSEKELGIYIDCVEDLPEPSRTILLLLPQTGMRISEVCQLKPETIQEWQGVKGFLFRGKRGKQRFIPLSKEANRIISEYILESGITEGWFFRSRNGEAFQPSAVRKHTRKIATAHRELKGLSPHILRHTFATRVLKRKIDIETLRVLMGHTSIQTTSRYLHPDAEMLNDAIKVLED